MPTTYTLTDLRNALQAAGVEVIDKLDENDVEVLEVTAWDGSYVACSPNTGLGHHDGMPAGIDIDYYDASGADEGKDWLSDVEELVDLARDIITKPEDY